MLKYDYHLHSSFSVDSDSPMEDMINKAISLELTEIAFTDHVDFLFGGGSYPGQYDFDEYYAYINEMKEKYCDKINIVFGVEFGLAPYLSENIKKLVEKYNYDFIIGSVHDFNGVEVHIADLASYGNNKNLYEGYFKHLLESIKSVDDFCVIGHVDYINRYSPFGDRSLKYSDYKEVIDNVLKEAICRGKGLELNTSGIRYGLGHLHPQLDTLKRYKELGGEIITIGSDAHNPKGIAEAFDIAEDMLKEAGFKAFTKYRNRKPEFVDLP